MLETLDKLQSFFIYYFEMLGDVNVARPQVAQTRLFDHLALIVGVRDPQGQAAAAGLGAGAPGRSLRHAVVVPAPGLSWHSWIGTEKKKQISCGKVYSALSPKVST